MLKLGYKKAVILFMCMLLMFVFIGVSGQTTSNLAYIPGHFMTNAVKIYIPFGF